MSVAACTYGKLAAADQHALTTESHLVAAPEWPNRTVAKSTPEAPFQSSSPGHFREPITDVPST